MKESGCVRLVFSKEMERKIIISNEKPEKLYQRLVDTFGVDWNDGIVICYGDTFYCKGQIPPPVFVHELEHVKQQEKIGKDLWWDLYLSNTSFRLTQETEAYRRQYQFVCDNILDKNQRFEFLYEMARILSSKMYGNMVDFSEAQRLISNNIK